MAGKIDFVIPWVDGNDEVWKSEKARYEATAADDDRDIRYRDWELLKYWFRAVEKNAPWVNRIHFITCGQVPKWLDTSHPKLNCVNHRDYIPEEYLPTFSSHPIELNMHRIEGLAEQFVYFNDDIFIVKPVAEQDFFVNGRPCDCGVESGITPRIGEFSSILCETVGVINRNFVKSDLKKRFRLKYRALNLRSLTMAPYHHIMGFYNPHITTAFCKSTLQEVWQKEGEILDATCRNRFRGKNDVSQYIFRYWNICKGEFEPRYPLGTYINADADISEIRRVMESSRNKIVSINDADGDYDFDLKKKELINLLEEKFPEKSSFEK